MEPAQAAGGADGEAIGFAASLRAIYRLMSPARRRHLWLVLGLSVLGGLAELVTIGAIVPFLSLLAAGRLPDIPAIAGLLTLFGGPTIAAATGLFIAAAILAGALRLLLAWTSLTFVQRLGHALATEIQRRILLQPYAYHLAHNSSEAVASLEQVDQLTYGVIQQFTQAAAATVIAAFIVAGIALIDARTALLASLAFAAAYALIVASFRSRLHSRSKVIAAAYGERVRLVQESVGGIRDVIVDQAQAAHIEAFRAADARLTKARTETTLAGTGPRFLIESAGMVILALIALALSRSAGGLAAALPVIGALALGAQRLLPLANQLYQGWSLAAANRALAERVAYFLRLPVAEDEAAAEPQPFDREIRFDRVSFTYPGRARPALDSLSVTLPKGSRTALTGATGSGKSTFADLAMGLLTPSSGAITIDGQPLAAAAWQRAIAHVPQSIFLIDASIADNIALSAPGRPVDRNRLARAAEIARIGDFIAALPDGFDTIVGERGVRLSGGQRQRLGIARALYKQAPVLILDEATSALDEETEAAVVAALEALPGLTVLVIAHRRSTIARCDRILRLSQGRLSDA